MEYVGLVAVIAGFEDERKRANDYITWLLQQRNGPVSVPDFRGRDDLTVVEVRGTVTCFSARARCTDPRERTSRASALLERALSIWLDGSLDLSGLLFTHWDV